MSKSSTASHRNATLDFQIPDLADIAKPKGFFDFILV